MGSGSPDVTTVHQHEVFTFKKWWRLQVPEERSRRKGVRFTGAHIKLILAQEMPQFLILTSISHRPTDPTFPPSQQGFSRRISLTSPSLNSNLTLGFESLSFVPQL